MDADEFDIWMRKVNTLLVKECGFGYQCLGDYRYADAFNDELTPEEVVGEVLEQEGFPMD